MLAALLSGLVEVANDGISQYPIVAEKDAFTVAPEDTRLKSESVSGAVYARLQHSPIYDTVTIKWLFSEANYRDFRSWFADTNQHGTLWFPLFIPLGIEPCTETKARLCFFIDSPPWTATRDGQGWVVTTKLRVKV